MTRLEMIELAVRRVYPFSYAAVAVGADGRAIYHRVWDECEPHIAEDPKIRKLVVDEWRRIWLSHTLFNGQDVTALAVRADAR